MQEPSPLCNLPAVHRQQRFPVAHSSIKCALELCMSMNALHFPTKSTGLSVRKYTHNLSVPAWSFRFQQLRDVPKTAQCFDVAVEEAVTARSFLTGILHFVWTIRANLLFLFRHGDDFAVLNTRQLENICPKTCQRTIRCRIVNALSTKMTLDTASRSFVNFLELIKAQRSTTLITHCMGMLRCACATLPCADPTCSVHHSYWQWKPTVGPVTGIATMETNRWKTEALTGVAEYLIGHGGVISEFVRLIEVPSHMVVFTDTDHAHRPCRMDENT